MKSERSFRRTILLTALTGHLAYSIAAEKPGLALVGICAAVLSAWLVRQTMQGRPRPLPRALLNGLVIAAIGHLTLQLIGRTQEPITSLTDFLAYVMIVKSLDRARMRDEAQLLGLSLFVVIGALLTGQSLGMGLALLTYTPLAIVSTVSLQLYHALERQRDLLKAVGLPEEIETLNHQTEHRRGPRSTVMVALVCAFASMGAGVFAFVITPRQLAQQLGMATAPFVKSPTTAFSDSMTLGSAGNITQDNTPVMDVRIVSGPGAGAGSSSAAGPIYLRGAVLSKYNKAEGKWSAGESLSTKKEYGGALLVPDAEGARMKTQYEVIQRSARNGGELPLFAPLHPVAVTLEGTGQLSYRGADALLHLNTSPGGRIAYTVTSASDYYEKEEGAWTPDTFSPRIHELAESIMKGKGVNTELLAQSPIETRRAAQAVIAHLSTFPYTLEMTPTRPGQDPIEMFLFETRQGHCEYFSAGAVALLSSVGVHARVAAGYAAAEYNHVTGYYTVRKSDAHAWIEVRMPSNRWETFDPTPPGELQSTRRASGGPIAWIKHLWDAVEFSWLDNVVAYDKGLKLDVGINGPGDAGAAAVRWQARLAAVREWIRTHLPEGVLTRSLMVGALTFVIVIGAYWGLRLAARASVPLRLWLTRFFPHRRSAGASSVVIPPDAAFYADALDALEAAGRSKPVQASPLAFAESLDAAAAAPFRAIARLYYRSRFRQDPLPAAAQADGRDALKLLRHALGHPAHSARSSQRSADRPRT